MDKLKTLSNGMLALIDELHSFSSFRARLAQSIITLEKQYQKGDFDFRTYKDHLEKLCAGKSEDEAISYYDEQMDILLSRLCRMNAYFFEELYFDKVPLETGGLTYEVPSSHIHHTLPSVDQVLPSESIQPLPPLHALNLEKKKGAGTQKAKQHPLLTASDNSKEKPIEKSKVIEALPQPTVFKGPASGVSDESIEESVLHEALLEKVPKPVAAESAQALPLPTMVKSLTSGASDESIEESVLHEALLEEVPKPLAAGPAQPPPKPKPLSLGKEIAYAFQAKTLPVLDRVSPQRRVTFSSVLNPKFIKYLFQKGRRSDEFFAESTKLLPSIFSYEEKMPDEEKILESEVKALDPFLLEKEIKEIKKLIETQAPQVYAPSSLGYFANIAVRRLSIYFIEKFPEVFRTLYSAIRNANIKLLSNTYINIMFFVSLLSFFVAIPSFAVLFALGGGQPIINIIKTFGFSVFLFFLVFSSFFYYPFMKMKKRRISINANLPFAIDHMSSVMSSGVPPATMFKLISASKEYGEISVEMEKVTNYIELFGYDLLTAIRSVSSITPSERMKEFFDGLVNTIETGGDLKNYLKQASEETLLDYRLERQRYVDSLATYSDIYTGVLIAAPLFFVTALSLVSVLGGSVGGVDVNVIITTGTYLVLPFLNILFIIFLEFNQPEI